MAYNKTTWENAPSTNTPINASNLNKIEEGIYQNSVKADQVGDLTTLKTTVKNNLVNAINENYDNIDGLVGTILWTNPNPTSNFDGQNVNLSNSDYDVLEIIFDQGAGMNKIFSQKFIKGKGTFLQCDLVAEAGIYFRWRNIIYVNDTEYTIGYGYQQIAGQSSSSQANSAIIPLYIIGYKIGLFS